MGQAKEKEEIRIKHIHKKANAWMINKMPKIWEEFEQVSAQSGLIFTEEQTLAYQKWIGKNLALAYAMGVNNQNEKKAGLIDRFGDFIS